MAILFDRLESEIDTKGRQVFITSDGKRYNQHQFAINHQVKINRQEETVAWERTAITHIRHWVNGHSFMTSDGKGFKKLHAALAHQIKLLQAGPLMHTQVYLARLDRVRAGQEPIKMTSAQLTYDNKKPKKWKRPQGVINKEAEQRRQMQLLFHEWNHYNPTRAFTQSKSGIHDHDIYDKQEEATKLTTPTKKPLPKTKKKPVAKTKSGVPIGKKTLGAKKEEPNNKPLPSILVGSRKDNKIQVEALSRNHAARVAADLEDVDMGRICAINTTKPADETKLCTSWDYPTEGTRKWKTYYEVYSYGTRIPLSRSEFEYTNMELVEGGFETKGAAVKRAKELAHELKLPMTVQITQKLVSHSHTVTDIEPKYTPGKFVVTFFE